MIIGPKIQKTDDQINKVLCDPYHAIFEGFILQPALSATPNTHVCLLL